MMSGRTFTDSEKSDGFQWHCHGMNGCAIEFWSCLFGKIAPASDMRIFSARELGGEDRVIGDVEDILKRVGYRSASVVELIGFVRETKWFGPGALYALGSYQTYSYGRDYPYVKAGEGWRSLGSCLMGPQTRLNDDDLFLGVRES